MLVSGMAFYEERIGVSPTFTLALLDPPAWKAVVGDSVPYRASLALTVLLDWARFGSQSVTL